jgi:hypothetical protein
MVECIENNPLESVMVLLFGVSILLFCLFSPNICMFIHKKHLMEKKILNLVCFT